MSVHRPTLFSKLSCESAKSFIVRMKQPESSKKSFRQSLFFKRSSCSGAIWWRKKFPAKQFKISYVFQNDATRQVLVHDTKSKQRPHTFTADCRVGFPWCNHTGSMMHRGRCCIAAIYWVKYCYPKTFTSKLKLCKRRMAILKNK